MPRYFGAILLFTTIAFAQTSVLLNSNSSVYNEIAESKTEFEMKKTKENVIDSIGVQIELFNDDEAKRSSAMFLVDGDKTTNNEKINIGGEWNIPVYLYKNTVTNGEIGYQAATTSFGFVVKNANEDFPFRFSAGPAFEGGLNRNLQSRDTIFGGGGYVSLFSGDSSGSKIKDTPLFFWAEIFGKYIKSKNDYNNATAKLKTIYEKNGAFQTDSFSITVTDTVGYGKVNSQFGYINGFRGNEVPSRYGNNLNVLLRATEIGEAFFQPSVEIYLNDNRYRYISDENFYGSLKKNTISALFFANKNLGNWEFETGLKISGTREENCYFTDNNRGVGRQSDTLNEKLKDADVFNPQYYFLAQYFSPKEKFGLSSKYAIERHRRVYPFSYRQNDVIFSSIDDFDNVTSIVGLQTDFYLTDWYSLYFSVENIKRQINNLKSQLSLGNGTQERFALGFGNVFSKDTSIIFSLSAKAVAEPHKYYFPQEEGVFPSHSRSFSIDSDFAFSYGNGWTNTFNFTTLKYDDGVIHDNIYGIDSKKRQTGAKISVTKTAQIFIAALGLEAKVQNLDRFDEFDREYLKERQYLFTPFVSGDFFEEDKFSLNFSVKRNMRNRQKNSGDFWEISLNLLAFF
jgi:hypothetical protein